MLVPIPMHGSTMWVLQSVLISRAVGALKHSVMVGQCSPLHTDQPWHLCVNSASLPLANGISTAILCCLLGLSRTEQSARELLSHGVVHLCRDK